MFPRNPSIVARYIFTILVVTLATLLRFALAPALGEGVPFILYYPTVVMCAWFGGLWPGLLSTVLGSIISWYIFIPPPYSWKVSDPTAAAAQLIVFLLAGTLISLLAESLHRARRKTEESEIKEREQREKLHVTLASIGDAVIATDAEGRVTFMNQVAQSLTGWKQEDASGKPLEEIFKIVNEQTRKQVENPALRAMREGVTVGLANHSVLIAKDGTEIPIDDSGAPIKDSKGKILGAVLIFRDITDRRRAEKERAALLVSEQAARAQAEKATEMIRRLQSMTDVALQHLSFDDLLHEMLSRVRELLMADSVTILLLTDDGRHLIMRATLGLEEELAREIRIPFGQGVAGHIAASHSPLVIEDLSKVEVASPILREKFRSLIGAPLLIEGRVIGVIHADTIKPRHFTEEDVQLLQLAADRIALAIDRTRLYEAEQSARIQAEDANRAKDEFLATVSHELRTPLNAILGWARLLRSGKLDDAGSIRAIEIIERNAKAQAQLIEDLLDISRIIPGKLLLETRLVELPPIIEAAINTVRPAADAKGIRFQVALEPGAGPIYGDPTRLQQIVWNLLSNAVKFTPSGGLVEVRLERVDPNVEITVSDSGQGISPDFLPYVFDRFRQADSTGTRKHGGLGLGLAIVSHLVELHGGTIQAESPGEGQGATFKVRLPLIAVKIEPVDAEAEHKEPSVESSRLFNDYISLEGLRLLVVDDDQDSREMIAFVLEQCRAEVRMAASAAEALTILDRWQPDLLISDISMPEMDGCELIRRVRSRAPQQGGRIPAVALTAYAGTEDRVRAISAGFQIHIPKPVDPAELITIIASLTGISGERVNGLGQDYRDRKGTMKSEKSEYQANILLVDDHPPSLFALEAILDGSGYNLVKADSGKAALESLLKQDIAVILLDVKMDGMDGFEVARLIREREQSKDTPIIFISGIHKSEEQMLRGYSLGAVDYLVKPIEPEVLRAKVAALVALLKKGSQAKGRS